MQSLQKDLAPFSYYLERLLQRPPCLICDLFYFLLGWKDPRNNVFFWKIQDHSSSAYNKVLPHPGTRFF